MTNEELARKIRETFMRATGDAWLPSDVQVSLKKLLDEHRPERDELFIEDIQNLMHANGVGRHINREDWGYRNSFVAGKADRPSIDRLVALGLMESRPASFPEGEVFITTEAGRALLGLSKGEDDE